MNPLLEWVYIAGLFLWSLFLVKRSGSSHKFLLFLIVWWLWAYTLPAIRNLIFPIAKGFEIQPSRVLLLLFFPYIFMKSLIGQRPRFLQESSFEKFLIAFYITGLVGLIYHLGGAIGSREAFVTYSGWLTFLAVYLILRQYADEGMIVGILRAFIAIAILSSIVAIIQFLFLTDFLRYTFERPAFGGHLRSNGLFRDEYVHSYFCIIASYATLLFVKNRLSKALILTTLAIGVALSFHRMSWAIFLITFGLSFFSLSKGKSLATKGLVVGAIVLAFISGNLWLESHKKSGFVQERVYDDTVTERVAFFEAAIKRISKEWMFGVGGVRTNAYYHDAVVSGNEYVVTEEVGGIHNLYLFLAYFYGTPVALSFTGFLVAAAFFFWKCLKRTHTFYLFPAMTVLMFILANLSNWFPPNTDIAIYLAIIIGLSLSVWKNGLENRISL